MVVLHVVLSSILVCTLSASQPRNTFNSGYILFSKDCGSFSKCIFLWRKISNFWRIFDGSRVLLVCCGECLGLTDELGLNFTPQDESICDDGRGSRAPTAHRLPCCHAPNIQCAITPSGQLAGRGQMFRFWKEIPPPKTGLQHDFCSECQCVMRCHEMSVTLSSVSR